MSSLQMSLREARRKFTLEKKPKSQLYENLSINQPHRGCLEVEIYRMEKNMKKWRGGGGGGGLGQCSHIVNLAHHIVFYTHLREGNY